MEHLNLTTIVDTDNLVKISISPDHNRTQAIDDYSEQLNNHIALGIYTFSQMQIFAIAFYYLHIVKKKTNIVKAKGEVIHKKNVIESNKDLL